MKITMEITAKTRLNWVNTVNRIRHLCHLRKREMPNVEVIRTKAGKKIGTIEY